MIVFTPDIRRGGSGLRRRARRGEGRGDLADGEASEEEQE
jgi:hypothetical protein